MKKLFVAVLVTAVAGVAGQARLAHAEDARAGAPRTAAVASARGVYNWAGFYIGGTVGAAWNVADVSLDTANAAGVLYRAGDIPLINALGSSKSTAAKAIIGGKIGYNWQSGSYVAGIEGDFSSFRFSNSASPSGNPFLSAPPYLFGFANFDTNVSSNWLATLRGRVGYADDKAYFYATGGAAISRVSFSNTYVAQSPLGFFLDVESSSAAQTKVGWAAGAGIDYALSAHWIASVEYLHIDLGSLQSSGVASSTGGGVATATLNYSTKLTSDIVRAGLAYKF